VLEVIVIEVTEGVGLYFLQPVLYVLGALVDGVSFLQFFDGLEESWVIEEVRLEVWLHHCD
jgi:hypothetical protein